MSIPINPPESPDLSGAILAITGVAATYPAQSAATQVRELLQAALTSDSPAADHLRVDTNDNDGITVTARIATTATSDSPEVARRVADVLLAERSDPAARVVVQIARIV